MTKEKWLDTAYWYMVKLTGPWENKQHLQDYCESLYEDYVEGNLDDPYTPQEAVDEDMTYWDNE